MTASSSVSEAERGHWAALSLGALGVVYGDIGTSPLYTIRECFAEYNGLAPTHENVLGILSLAFWALVLAVTVKYVLVILRADNNGEGGIIALMALTRQLVGKRPWIAPILFSAGLVGTALFFGDAAITPAISVLSAVEGLEIATTMFKPYVVPIAGFVLVLLFAMQSRGTGSVGRLFGPIIACWFCILGVLGALAISRAPQVLQAVDPRHAVGFIAAHGWGTLVSLGSVFLAVTGAEALYADLGHFGRTPIRRAWFALVLPGLVLNYFGQGALILQDPSAVRSPFYLLVPSELLYPMVALATVATVIASQAVISGAFSLFHQAMQLGLAPRMGVRHTSAQESKQVYLPQVNWGLLCAVLALVIGFGSSGALASAYGIAVNGTEIVTTLLAFWVAVYQWRWPRLAAILVFGAFLVMDVTFLAANSLKVVDGGWVSLLIGAAVFTVSSTWIRGRAVLYQKLQEGGASMDDFLRSVNERVPRVAGTAVFLARVGETVPHALLHNVKHNKVLHQRVLLMSVLTEDVPVVPRERRVEVTALEKGFYRVVVRYGFMQGPNLPKVLALCSTHGLGIDLHDTSFFLGRVTLVPALKPRLAPWRRSLYFALARNASSATDFFRIPTDRVVEVGAQIAL